MKAIILKENGGPEKLTIADVPVPEIGPEEILVNVKAISVNPVDASARQSSAALQHILNPGKDETYHILGWDISGTVEKTGDSVGGFKNGDDVFAMVNFPGNGKAYAEYVAVPAGQAAHKPANTSHEEAAAATLAALTAWQSLVKLAKVKGGEKVLIHAAAGGVGHYAVQIAKYFGAYVIGTASEKNHDFLRELGADECIDYTTEKFEDKVHDADIIIDSIGGDHLLRSLAALKNGGRLVCLKGEIDDNTQAKAREKNVQAMRQMVTSNGDDMKHIAQLLEESQIHSFIFRSYRFDQMPDAHRQIETRKTRGKIVVEV